MFNKSVCLLFSGRAGVGKSTSAHYICDTAPKSLKCTVGSFATPIKTIAKSYMNWDGNKDEKGRVLLQDLGKVGRNYNENTWVSALFDTLIPKRPGYPFDLVIIDDWRFPNEANYIKSLPLYNIYTARIYAPKLEKLKGTERYNDISEVSLPVDPKSYDFVISNTGDIENDLWDQLNLILYQIIKENTYGGL